MKYEVVIGLEVHLQLSTASKVFCGCANEFGREPNTLTCPVCLGFPGSLPVLNRQALASAIKVAVALNCPITDVIKFDRKNYYYPDLPKNYQISQYAMPIAQRGSLALPPDFGGKTINIRRVHLEEDAGKLIHKGDHSLVDFNRSGAPLLEIVTEPEISSPDEAYAYLTALKSVIMYLDVSDCNMEEGSLRCDANVSLRPAGVRELGIKTELKNMNSFRNVRNGLRYEIDRHIEVLEGGGKVVQETRLWDAEKGSSGSMRSKEEAHDYRYFPEPDLAPFVAEERWINEIRSALPELPEKRKKRLVKDYSLSEYDASVLTQDKATADFFENAAGAYPNAKGIANWIMGDISAVCNERNAGISSLMVRPKDLAEMVRMVDDGVISGKIAKDVLSEMIETGARPEDIVKRRGLAQISDSAELERITARIIIDNPGVADDYRAGKKTAMAFFVGQVMKATKGKANPGIVNEILKRKLG